MPQNVMRVLEHSASYPSASLLVIKPPTRNTEKNHRNVYIEIYYRCRRQREFDDTMVLRSQPAGTRRVDEFSKQPGRHGVKQVNLC
jgi:hypothetical protein